MGIRKKLQQSKPKYGEDRIVENRIENSYMVIDGATPLYSKEMPKPNSFGFRYATWTSMLVSELKRKLTNTKDTFKTLNDVSKEMYALFEKYNLNNKRYFPSCNLAYAKINDDTINVSVIGDCECLIKFKNGRFKRIYQPELKELDRKALEEYIRRDAKSINDIMDILRDNRSLMNEDNGYSTYTLSDKPNFKYTNETLDKKDIDTIYLYTDGISQAFEEFKIYNSPEELFGKNDNIDIIVQAIVDAAKEDKNIIRHPRFKYIDDIAIIKLTFND